METKNVIAALVVAAVLVAIVTIGIALVRLELSMIYTLALILVGALSVALVIAALALPIRANKSGEPHERERIIERHTIDGRRDPNIITLPHNRSDADALFPRLMRDMLDGQQHLLGDGRNTNSSADEDDEVNGDDWQGPIRG
jgi:hypothetical protein